MQRLGGTGVDRMWLCRSCGSSNPSEAEVCESCQQVRSRIRAVLLWRFPSWVPWVWWCLVGLTIIACLVSPFFHGQTGSDAAAVSQQEVERNPHPGFQPLLGYCNPGVDVYFSAAPQNQPVYLFTIVDPIVDMDGQRYILVRYRDGNTEYKLRDAMVRSPYSFVRESEE